MSPVSEQLFPRRLDGLLGLNRLHMCKERPTATAEGILLLKIVFHNFIKPVI